MAKRIRKASGIGGSNVKVFPDPVIATRAPASGDSGYEIGQGWIDNVNFDAFFLCGFSAGVPQWINAGGGSGSFSTLTVSGAVTLSNLGLGVVRSTAAGVLSSVNGTNGQVIIGSTGVAPAWGTITSGDGSVVIGVGAGTLDLTVSGATASTFPTDAGTATPVLGATTIAGGTNVNTSAAGGTVTINVDTAPTFSGLVTGQAGLTVSAGTTTITSDTNAADAIYLRANGGANETIRLHADQGTSADSVNILSDVGGITIQAVGLASDDAINIEADAGGIDMDAAMQFNIASSEAAIDAIRINASNAAGGIDLDTGTGGLAVDTTGAFSLDGAAASNVSVSGAGIDLTLASSAGRVIVQGDEATANAVTIVTTSGGIDADAVLQINIASSQVAADAIRIIASDAGGGLDVDCGTGGMTFTAANGAIALASGTGTISVGNQATTTTVGVLDVAPTASRTITIGGGTVVTAAVTDTVDIAPDGATTNADSVKAVNINTGGVTTGQVLTNIASGTVTSGTHTTAIASGNRVAGTMALNVMTGTGTKTLNMGNTDALTTVNIRGAVSINESVNIDTNINTGTSTGTVNLGNALAGSLNATFASGISLNGGAAGGFDIVSTLEAANAITIDAQGAAGGVHIKAGSAGIEIGNEADTAILDLGDFAPTSSRTITVGGGTVITAAVTDTIDIGPDGATTNANSVKMVNVNTGGVTTGQVLTSIATGTVTSGTHSTYIATGNRVAGTMSLDIMTGTGIKTLTVGNVDGLTDTIVLSPRESSAGLAHTLNATRGRITATGVTTASTVDETLTITNSTCATTSGIMVSLCVVGAEDARPVLQKVRPGAGSFTILYTNEGAAALASNLIIAFEIYN